MEVESNSNKQLIERSLNATEKAIEAIREGDLTRRQTALELRDMQLSMHEDFERLRGMIKDFEDQIHKEHGENSKWMDRKLGKAKATADQALSSTLMVKDVQMLEKKVNILKESVIQVNKAYYKYEKQVDMKDLMDQVTDMVYRTEKKEKEALDGRKTDEETMEQYFRGAIEGLYGLKSENPKVMEEAKHLALDLRVFRDAAANKNFHAMISKGPTDTATTRTKSSSSESAFTTSTESKSTTTSASASSSATGSISASAPASASASGAASALSTQN